MQLFRFFLSLLPSKITYLFAEKGCCGFKILKETKDRSFLIKEAFMLT